MGESDSNAAVERAIQDVEGQTRTLRAGLEKNIGRRIELGDEVTPWMMRHAACLAIRCRVRPNGRTSMEMMKGRRTNSRVAEFGETIMFKILKTEFNPGKFEDRWHAGVYFGFDMIRQSLSLEHPLVFSGSLIFGGVRCTRCGP